MMVSVVGVSWWGVGVGGGGGGGGARAVSFLSKSAFLPPLQSYSGEGE